jgi:RND family efflux transporter MFP subunit
VKVIRPKRAQDGFARTVTQPAYVQGVFQAELMARVAGQVKSVAKNIGDSVKAGEVLVELDVPDLEQEVIHKVALVRQAEQDAKAAEANVAVMQAAVRQAETVIQQKDTDVERALAKKKYHEAEVRRFKVLQERNAVIGGVLDERIRDLEASEAEWKSAQVAVAAAQASLQESKAKLEAAQVDVRVKQARIAVAAADRGQAQAMLDFAKIRAPFNGVIVSRKVDPGDFVQNASTRRPAPLLTVVRSDIVTLVMWVPEKDAPLVTKSTRAVIQLDALADRNIEATVSRFSRFLDPDKSRDMRVEVDLPNPGNVLEPGMYGTMKLILERFDHACLIPESAVFQRGGQTCIFEVKDRVARMVPVRVQFEDGVQAKVAKLPRGDAGKADSKLQELTGTEEIVQSGHGEISDGHPVNPALVEW